MSMKFAISHIHAKQISWFYWGIYGITRFQQLDLWKLACETLSTYDACEQVQREQRHSGKSQLYASCPFFTLDQTHLWLVP